MIPYQYDRRRKLKEGDTDAIQHKYKLGQSIKSLAKEYGVSRRLIQITVKPEVRRQMYQRHKEHWREYAPTKEERKQRAAEHRKYIKQLKQEGKI